MLWYTTPLDVLVISSWSFLSIIHTYQSLTTLVNISRLRYLSLICTQLIILWVQYIYIYIYYIYIYYMYIYFSNTRTGCKSQQCNSSCWCWIEWNFTVWAYNQCKEAYSHIKVKATCPKMVVCFFTSHQRYSAAFKCSSKYLLNFIMPVVMLNYVAVIKLFLLFCVNNIARNQVAENYQYFLSPWPGHTSCPWV